MEEEVRKFFIGIDLGGKTRASTGLCILEEFNGKLGLSQAYCKICHDLRYAELFETLKPYLERTEVIAIDGPLTLGKGKGLMRLYEKFLSTKIFRQARVTPLPPALMPSLSVIGQELVEELKEYGFVLDKNLIETFPTLVKEICHKDFLRELLKNETSKKETKIPCKTSNQKAALICAAIAWLHSNFKTRWLGYKDGFLFLPEMSFWKKEWCQKFYQAWMEKSRLKYRYLLTNIFRR